jgi:hypothetical protein
MCLPTGPPSEWLFVPRLPGLWKLIIPTSNLRLGCGLKQTCSSPQELSNGVSHSTCTHRGWVDSRLLMVRSQTASLSPAPSFDRNCAAYVQMTHARPFWTSTLQDLSNGIFFNARCFDPCNQALSFRESRKTPNSHFWECEFHPHTCLKVWGCDNNTNAKFTNKETYKVTKCAHIQMHF